MFKDELRDKVWNEIRQSDLRTFARQLTPEVFAEAAEQSKARIGSSALNVVNLVWLGISAAMQHACNFAFVLTTTLKLLEDQQGFAETPLGKEKKKAGRRAKRKQGKRRRKSKHDPRREDPTQVSEEAFSQARQRMPLGFWMALLTILAKRFQRDRGEHSSYRGFRLLAIDGTTLHLSNYKQLREHYGKPKNGRRKQAAPQARMVMLTLPGTRIPLAYEVAPLADIETTYFELKEVLKVETLRSRTPASLEYELAGRVVYYLLVRWLIVQAAEEAGLDPLRISFSNAIRELELMRAALVTGSPDWVRKTLLPRMLARLASHTVPLRPGRHYPRPKDTQPKDRGRGQRQASAKIHSRVNTKHDKAQRKTRRQA